MELNTTRVTPDAVLKGAIIEDFKNVHGRLREIERRLDEVLGHTAAVAVDTEAVSSPTPTEEE
jgi:hypothetical protein